MFFCALLDMSPTTKSSWEMQILRAIVRVKDDSNDYVIRVLASPAQGDAQEWNALLAVQEQPTPFMRHQYLAAMHDSMSAVARTGWTPRFVTLRRGAELHAACALYL